MSVSLGNVEQQPFDFASQRIQQSKCLGGRLGVVE